MGVPSVGLPYLLLCEGVGWGVMGVPSVGLPYLLLCGGGGGRG